MCNTFMILVCSSFAKQSKKIYLVGEIKSLITQDREQAVNEFQVVRMYVLRYN